jgi:hypothetical protein
MHSDNIDDLLNDIDDVMNTGKQTNNKVDNK